MIEWLSIDPRHMPYRLCKTIDIENGHMLSKHREKCRFPHGHTRKVEFLLEADTLDEREMVCDFKLIKEAVGEYLDSLDHAMCVNSEDPATAELVARYGDRIVVFERLDPTTEVLAAEIYRVANLKLASLPAELTARYPLRPSVRLKSVKVWETATSWAEYFE